ncbi:hypothetical protein GCM10027088_02630 [Nocardia goodfellowii]
MVRVGALEFLRQLGERRAVTRSRFMESSGEAQPFGFREHAHRILEFRAVAVGKIVSQVSIDQRFHPNLRWLWVAECIVLDVPLKG